MLRRACTAILFAVLCAVVASRGPLSLRKPATVLSNAMPTQKDTEPFLLFLHWAAERVPRGATVAVRTPDALWFFVAVGQLPDQEVWPATGEGGPLSGAPAEWVACYFANLDDPRYRRVETYDPNGSLFRRVP